MCLQVDDFDMSLGMVIASEPMFSRPLPGSSLLHMLPFEGHGTLYLDDNAHRRPRTDTA